MSKHYTGEIVMHNGFEVRIIATWEDDGKQGITIEPTGNYGFPIDIYEEQLNNNPTFRSELDSRT